MEEQTSLGKKKPRKDDYDYDVEPAPDSSKGAMKRKQCEDTMHNPKPKQNRTESKHSIGNALHSACLTPTQEIKQVQCETLNFSEIAECASHFDFSDEDENPVKHSTPKPSNKVNSFPWDMPEIKYQGIPQTNDMQALQPGNWLNSSVIEDAISALVCNTKQNSNVLACPTYIYQCVKADTPDVFYPFLEGTAALNKDILLIPFNTDVWGTGFHWCFGVVIFSTHELVILDSMKNKSRSKAHGEVLLRIVAACYQIADATFNKDEWNVILCSDAVQQSNSDDCGLYTILNAFTIIAGKTYDIFRGHLYVNGLQ